MSKSVIELEKELAEAKAKETKLSGFDVVVFNEKDELDVVKAKANELTEKAKADLMQYASLIGDNLQEVEKLSEALSKGRTGDWLAFSAFLEKPISGIISVMFGIEKEKVATLPNIELLGYLLNENQWINGKAEKMAKELEFIKGKMV